MQDNEPKAMAEIHEIRERQQREMEGMGVEEQIRYIREKAESLIKRYNLKIPRQIEPTATSKK